MSHVHDLFHARPAKARTARASGSAPSPPDTAVKAPALAPEPARFAHALEFPAVEARVSAKSRLVFHTDPHSPGADRFRLIRMRLRDSLGAATGKTLLVTSPLP